MDESRRTAGQNFYVRCHTRIGFGSVNLPVGLRDLPWMNRLRYGPNEFIGSLKPGLRL